MSCHQNSFLLLETNPKKVIHCSNYRPPNLQKDKGYGIFVACARKASEKTSATDSGYMRPTSSVLRQIGDHVAEIQATIAENSDHTNANSAVERRVAA